jgi:hypothetical protein
VHHVSQQSSVSSAGAKVLEIIKSDLKTVFGLKEGRSIALTKLSCMIVAEFVKNHPGAIFLSSALMSFENLRLTRYITSLPWHRLFAATFPAIQWINPTSSSCDYL